MKAAIGASADGRREATERYLALLDEWSIFDEDGNVDEDQVRKAAKQCADALAVSTSEKDAPVTHRGGDDDGDGGDDGGGDREGDDPAGGRDVAGRRLGPGDTSSGSKRSADRDAEGPRQPHKKRPAGEQGGQPSSEMLGKKSSAANDLAAHSRLSSGQTLVGESRDKLSAPELIGMLTPPC
jgi:hypothetical protein